LLFASLVDIAVNRRFYFNVGVKLKFKKTEKYPQVMLRSWADKNG
jgi:hypothetical protein